MDVIQYRENADSPWRVLPILKGDKGDTGDQGPTGPQGEQGPRGIQGIQGEKGDKGDTGAQGPQGERGLRGFTGPQGPQGERGLTGPQGETGPAGPQGPQGEQGPRGYTGLEGPQGDAGEDGYTPVKGVDYFTDAEIAEIIDSTVAEIDLSDYALKTDIPSVPTNVSAFTNDAGYLTEHQSLEGYATKDYVAQEIAEAQLSGEGTVVDLSNYALKTDIPTIPTNISAFTNDKGYLTEHQDLSAYALKSEIPNVSAYQTAAQVQTLIDTSLDAIGVAEDGEF